MSEATQNMQVEEPKRRGRPPLVEKNELAHKIEVQAQEKPRMKLKTVYLHQAIRITGKTETTINTTRIPNLTSMEWAPNGMLFIKAMLPGGKIETHVLHGAAVADSVLDE